MAMRNILIPITRCWPGLEAGWDAIRRYLILGLDHPDYRVLIRRLDGQAAGPDEVSVNALSPPWQHSMNPSSGAFFDAQNLRLQRYLGESIASEAIDERFQTVLDRISDQPPEWQGLAAFEAAAHSRAIKTRYLQALPLYTRRDSSLFKRLGTRPARPRRPIHGGWFFWRSGELNQAAADFEAAATIRQRLGDHFGLAVIDNNLGLVLKELGDLDSAELALEQATRTLSRRAGFAPADQRRGSPGRAGADGKNRPDLPSALNTLNNLALLQRGPRTDRTGRTLLAQLPGAGSPCAACPSHFGSSDQSESSAA